jgi:hypothetical protein
MLHGDYDRKGSVEKQKIYDREPQWAWLQDKLIEGKLPVVK